MPDTLAPCASLLFSVLAFLVGRVGCTLKPGRALRPLDISSQCDAFDDSDGDIRCAARLRSGAFHLSR